MADTDGQSFCFVHAADLHLDTPFKGIHGVAPDVALALREASLDAFDAIVDLAIARQAVFVLFAGDVYDGAERGLRAQLRFQKGLMRLSNEAVASFVVHGNHDPLESGWSAIQSWPDGTTIFPSDRVGLESIKRDGATIATVQGISYATAATTENLALRFSRPPCPGFHVGLLHCNVEGSPKEHANYSPCSLDDLLNTGLDYLALGHVHKRQVLAGTLGQPSPFVVYSGNSQSRSMKESEREEKGALVVSVVGGVVESLEFVACDRVRFAEINCDIDDLGDLGELEDRLVQSARGLHTASDGRGVVVRARLTGQGELHGDLSRPTVIEELVGHLRHGSEGTSPFLWWDEVLDDSTAVIDADSIRGRGDFASDLLELVDSLALDDVHQDRLIDAILATAPRPLISRLDVIANDVDERHAVVARAAVLALDALRSEDP